MQRFFVPARTSTDPNSGSCGGRCKQGWTPPHGPGPLYFLAKEMRYDPRKYRGRYMQVQKWQRGIARKPKDFQRLLDNNLVLSPEVAGTGPSR